MAPKRRLRGHDLALELDLTAQFDSVAEARIHQRYLSEDEKIRALIPLNIYDAARSYREHQGLTGTSIRSILRDERFRNAWGTFKGGHRWTINDTGTRVKAYRKKGGITSTTKEKMDAAKTLGWYDSKKDAIDHLRNMSP